MLDKKDEKTIEKIVEKVTVKVMGEALEQIVLPQIQEVRSDISDLKRENNEDHQDLHDTTTRIELKLNAVVKRQDERGVLKLEPKI